MREAKQQLEPFEGCEHYPLHEHVEVSRSISLKRIADTLERLADPNSPTNVYGEGWSEALQNSIARGLRGVEVPR